MKYFKSISFFVIVTFVLVGAGCTSQVFDYESMTSIGDLYFELPGDDWLVQGGDSDLQITLVSPSDYITDLSASDAYTESVVLSDATPSFSGKYADVYRDGCGGGWCAFYVIDFHDGTQFDLFFAGDPMSDEDMEIILTSLVK
ncbi:hypothetical protein HN358_02700 [Candidatus Uhrbacteria bacterium]|jgi:hypothetical protein|nr:hypothetical protein [Candidatus Uhrbacteria bacterium]MBT7717589.1 hypothetical protein [Candidatus Uhrbacteria bacterium]